MANETIWKDPISPVLEHKGKPVRSDVSSGYPAQNPIINPEQNPNNPTDEELELGETPVAHKSTPRPTG